MKTMNLYCVTCTEHVEARLTTVEETHGVEGDDMPMLMCDACGGVVGVKYKGGKLRPFGNLANKYMREEMGKVTELVDACQ